MATPSKKASLPKRWLHGERLLTSSSSADHRCLCPDQRQQTWRSRVFVVWTAGLGSLFDPSSTLERRTSQKTVECFWVRHRSESSEVNSGRLKKVRVFDVTHSKRKTQRRSFKYFSSWGTALDDGQRRMGRGEVRRRTQQLSQDNSDKIKHPWTPRTKMKSALVATMNWAPYGGGMTQTHCSPTQCRFLKSTIAKEQMARRRYVGGNGAPNDQSGGWRATEAGAWGGGGGVARCSVVDRRLQVLVRQQQRVVVRPSVLSIQRRINTHPSPLYSPTESSSAADASTRNERWTTNGKCLHESQSLDKVSVSANKRQRRSVTGQSLVSIYCCRWERLTLIGKQTMPFPENTTGVRGAIVSHAPQSRSSEWMNGPEHVISRETFTENFPIVRMSRNFRSKSSRKWKRFAQQQTSNKPFTQLCDIETLVH